MSNRIIESSNYEIRDELLSDDRAANLALFLTVNCGSCLATWRGRMSAKDQRRLFGRFLGKGLIQIDGERELLDHWRKVCFGLDSECTARIAFRDL